MTNFTKRLMVAAATLVVAAGAASAQTLKAEIPFTFRTGTVVMPAGTYRISPIYQSGGQIMFRLGSYDGHNAVLLVPKAFGDPRMTWADSGNPVLTFECGVSRCALVGLWTGPETPAYVLPRPKLGRDEPARVATIAMRVDKAD